MFTGHFEMDVPVPLTGVLYSVYYRLEYVSMSMFFPI